MKKLLIILSLVSLFLFFSTTMVLGQPEAPTIEESSSSRRDPDSIPNQEIQAVAGNVTALSIHGVSSTQTWQGFFGNITGELVLSNGANQIMYDWNIILPRGKLYASYDQPINWAPGNIECYDFSREDFEDYFILKNLSEDMFNIPSHAPDNINTTFNLTEHPTIYVGSHEILEDTCHSTKLYENEEQGENFIQLLLYADNSRSVIFTSLLSGQTEGFDGSIMDFQMIVPADGREGSTAETTYYLYIELE